ncbi:hypothetical protein CRV12_02380 [Candidatus Pantoea edessiphila]|uniref:Cell division protein FtsH n=1 Tax=Candidatus Pantoea edessiphila TaxID=2044610 RepID=A0A2P5SZR2_9GAMM|nr:YqjK family protein [Candidatus Pantoea edessiphila]PPI87821.1 hypothetical protein CRV12_02380 [Candidatus Pantoea edessiphila]
MHYQKRRILINLICSEIHNQRVNLSKLKSELMLKTKKYDNCWLTLLDMQKYLLIGTSILAIWSTRARKFNSLIRLMRYGFGLWNVWKTIRSFKETFFKKYLLR